MVVESVKWWWRVLYADGECDMVVKGVIWWWRVWWSVIRWWRV